MGFTKIELLEPIARKSPVTFSIPWARNHFYRDDSVEYSLDCEETFGLDHIVLAYWENGSVKWTSHTLQNVQFQHIYVRKAPSKIVVTQKIHIKDDYQKIIVSNNSGNKIYFNKSGSVFAEFPSIDVTGIIKGSSSSSQSLSADFTTEIENSSVESITSDRLVVLTTGLLLSSINKNSFLLFKIRSYIYADTDLTKYNVSIVYNLNQQENLRSLGLEFSKSLADAPLYDRHIKMTASDGGVLSESCQSITGLWHAAGSTIRYKQANGEALPSLEDPEWEWNTDGLSYVPSYNEYSLKQLSSHGFEIAKRFKQKFSKIKVIGGSRNDGSVFVGSPQSGGLSIGLTKFWEKYPSELKVTDFANDVTKVQVWFYSPSASPLDVSPYCDGLVATDYKKQIEGLQVTYEDYEPGLGSALGISRSFEVYMEPFNSNGERVITSKSFKEFALLVRQPPLLIAELTYIYQCQVFPFWIPDYHMSDRVPTSKEVEVESNLTKLFEYYKKNIEINDWYGFWDYGDVMHTPDTFRHQWRYDVGGYAWDNSELSTDLWLWMYFLHTGRADVFRIAESMTKHTGEVDVYHSGELKGFGTRHGVQHWSDSSKQLRISNVLFRRFYYYLSGGDERIGELMDELKDSQQSMLKLDSHRKVQQRLQKLPDNYAMANIGLDWGSLLGAWMTNWERRTENWESSKNKLITSIKSLIELPHGFANNAVLMNVNTGECKPVPPPTPEWAISHLSTVFGLNESMTELIEIIKLVDEDLSKKLITFWTDYAISFNGSKETQIEKYGFEFPKGNISLQQSHARCTSYVSWNLNDKSLAKESWNQFFHTDGYSDEKVDWKFNKLNLYDSVTGAMEELPFITTNFTAQYGISAIYMLAKSGAPV